jgi:TRAP-type transport system periplasmic protein
MKTRALVVLVIVLVSALVIGSCAPASQTPPTTAPPTTTPAPKIQPIELKMGYITTSGSSMEMNAIIPWEKLVEQKSNGLIKFTNFANQTLFKAPQSFEGLKGGIGDISWIPFAFFGNQFSLSRVIELPLIDIPTAEVGSQVLQELYEKYPAVGAEFPEGIKMLFLHASDEYAIFTTKKPVKNRADLEGMKIRSMPEPQASVWKTFNAVPSFISTADVYTSAEKGIIDAMAMNWGSLEAFRYFEVFKYYTDLSVNRAAFCMAMSSAKWNSLPQEAKDILNSVSGVYGAKFFGREHFDKGKTIVFEQMKKGNFDMQKVSLDPGELDKWKELAGKPIWDKWIADRITEKKPGKEIFDDTLKLLAQYSKK